MNEIERSNFQRHVTMRNKIDQQSLWNQQGQPWRTEPEIDVDRQAELTRYLAIAPDIEHGIYPFKDVKLERADIEWLLAHHENGRGPVLWRDESQRSRVGLDLRGADLRGADLFGLPLARTLGEVLMGERPDITEVQRAMAGIRLDGADLKGTRLEGAMLSHAQLSKADLRSAHLEYSRLGRANLQDAFLFNAHLEGAFLMRANLKGSVLWQAYVAGATFRSTHLDDATLDNIWLCDKDDKQRIGPHLADVFWGNANLSVVDWSQFSMLGEEYEARQVARDGKQKSAERRLREYKQAVRAYRQLSVALQNQGIYEDAARFSYHAQVLQRTVLHLQKHTGQYLFSYFLDILAGYGYRPGRTVITYLLVIGLFALTYALLSLNIHPGLSPLGCIIFSVTSFHGRGFFPGGLPLDSPLTVLAACEAVIGLVIEISFIATFTQRFFGK